jgi:hypothetical protein
LETQRPRANGKNGPKVGEARSVKISFALVVGEHLILGPGLQGNRDCRRKYRAPDPMQSLVLKKTKTTLPKSCQKPVFSLLTGQLYPKTGWAKENRFLSLQMV